MAARWRRGRPAGLASVVRRQRSACWSRDCIERPGIQDFGTGTIVWATGDEAQAARETPTLRNPSRLLILVPPSLRMVPSMVGPKTLDGPPAA
jgi:hypothetical protein